MDSRSDSDRDLRKEIAADAAEPEETPSIFVRAGQFFLVPLVIVTACVGVYAFFRYMAAEPGTPHDLLTQIRSGGAASRKHASLQLAQVLQEQYQKKQLDPQLFEPLLLLFNDLPSNEAPADAITLKLVGEGPSMRAVVAKCLAYYHDPRAVPSILKAMKEERNAETMAQYLDALGTIRSPEAAPELINLLDHPSSKVRKFAAFNLAVVAAPRVEKAGEATDGKPVPPAAPEAIPHLLRKLNDLAERDEVRWNAAVGLALFLKNPAGRDVILQMLDRAHLEKVIGANKNEPYATELVAHAMKLACHAAVALEDRAFTPALAKAEKDPDSNIRAVARWAQEQIAKKN